MPKIPLQTSQEKILYLASLMGFDNALSKLEDLVREKFVTEVPFTITKLRKVK